MGLQKLVHTVHKPVAWRVRIRGVSTYSWEGEVIFTSGLLPALLVGEIILTSGLMPAQLVGEIKYKSGTCSARVNKLVFSFSSVVRGAPQRSKAQGTVRQRG